ncbi:MAG: RNA polymerase sigma factor [Planctomycetota bacterium]
MTEAEQRNTLQNPKMEDVHGAVTPQMLVRKYSGVVLGLCLAHTKHIHDAEDIMQEVFLKAFTKLGTLRDSTKARAWLCQIARRACVDYYRKRPSPQTLPDDVPARSKSDESVTRLRTAISKLPEGHREVITLYYLDGRKCAHIAQVLEINEDAVRSRLMRARFALHNLLTEDQS